MNNSMRMRIREEETARNLVWCADLLVMLQKESLEATLKLFADGTGHLQLYQTSISSHVARLLEREALQPLSGHWAHDDRGDMMLVLRYREKV